MSYNNNILVIDDDEEILGTFRCLLGGHGITAGASLSLLQSLLTAPVVPGGEQRKFTIKTARQGEAGLQLVKEALGMDQPFAVAFVDMRMPPGWDGIRTIREIHEVDPHIQIVIVTAYSDATISEIVCRVGFTDRLLYLKKPFDHEEVLQLADSLSMRWNLELKVRTFISILEGIVANFADLNLAGNEEQMRPFLEKILGQLGDFLGTEHIFLAKIKEEQVKFRIGLGKFSNGISAKPAFQEIVRRVLNDEHVETIFRVDEYLVVPLLLRSCKNVVVGILPEREVEGIDRLLKVLAVNAAKIFDQGARIAGLCNEVEHLRERERKLMERIHHLEQSIE